ncbi:acyl carrier protein [bacterium]|nr:acyl carrier protein [bacterium]
MTIEEAKSAVYEALQAVRGVSDGVELSASLTRDLGLESIDVVDLFFEIEQGTGVVIELTQLVNRPGTGGRRFEAVCLQDLVDYLSATHG